MGLNDDWSAGECPSFLYTDPSAHAAAKSMFTTLGTMCKNKNPSFVEINGFDLSNEQWAEAFRLLFGWIAWTYKPVHVRYVGVGMISVGLGRAIGKEWHLVDPVNPMKTIQQVIRDENGILRP